MLSKVSAYSYWRSVPTLALSELGIQADPIQVKDIKGLEPVGATINTTPYGSIDGEAYVGSSISSRNIVLTVELNPDWANWTMEDLRRLLYRYFMPKRPVRLVFDSDDDFPSVYIDGYTETVDPSMFAKEQEIQISIVCPDPYFYGVDPVIISGELLGDSFEIDYDGSVETGFNVTVSNAAHPLPISLYVQVGDPSEEFFGVLVNAVPGLYFRISSIPGKKYAQSVNTVTGVITNLLPFILPGSTWPTLKPGSNTVRIYTSLDTLPYDLGVQSWELAYVPKFGGL